MSRTPVTRDVGEVVVGIAVVGIAMLNILIGLSPLPLGEG
jgi:hypothetical protein